MAFLGVQRKAGQVIKQRVQIAQFSDGSPVLLPVATITGRRDGPTALVMGGTHGDETTGIEVARRVIDDIKPSELRGSVVVVPVCGVPAYLTRSRGWALEERLEMHGFSRLSPGQQWGLMSERIAYVIWNEFLSHADLSIDMHSALDGCNIVPFTYVQPDRGDGTYELRKRIALGFGTPYVYRIDVAESKGIDRSLLPLSIRGTGQVQASTGKARIIAEMGESRRVSWEYVPIGVRGVRRSLQIMKALPGEPEPLKEPQREFSHVAPVHVNSGGGLHLLVKEGEDVKKDQRIGWIEDVFGEKVDDIVAPVSGFIQRKMKLANVATGAEAVWIGYNP